MSYVVCRKGIVPEGGLSLFFFVPHTTDNTHSRNRWQIYTSSFRFAAGETLPSILLIDKTDHQRYDDVTFSGPAFGYHESEGDQRVVRQPFRPVFPVK